MLVKYENQAYNLVDFLGKPLRTYKTHGINGASATTTELYVYSFDKAQRLRTTTHQLNSGSTVTLSDNTYDDLGRLLTKKVGNSIETTAYAYNIRNWVTGITGARFSEGLLYNVNTGNLVASFAPSYNGNIAAMQWSIPVENMGYNRTYAFAYDGLNRLVNSAYGGYNGSAVAAAAGKYNETMNYDKMGNITSLYRYDNGTYLNSLTFDYTGNQLKTVNDALNVTQGYGSEKFIDNVKLTSEYAFDANGNMTWDANSKISTIQYNLLNLPNVMQFTDGHQNYYTYNAAGQKLNLTNYTLNAIVNVPQGTVNPAPTGAYVKTVTDYVGNMLYQNSVLKMILTPEGYIQNGVYYYYLKDHLGNNRVVINGSGTVIERNHYYPSGMRFTSEGLSNSAALPFRYGGKELEAMNGLNQYDFKARRKFAWGPILTTPDPLAEKHPDMSPYAYCGNNPIRFIDPFGLDTLNVNMNTAAFTHIKAKKGNDVVNIVDDDGIVQNTLTLPRKSIISSRNQKNVSYTDKDGVEKTTDVDIIKIRGDKNATDLFNFLEGNFTKDNGHPIEFSHIMTGEEGNKGLNFITTGHVEGTDPGQTTLVVGQLYDGYSIRDFTHNHPSGSIDPSGLRAGPQGQAPGTWGDIGNRNWNLTWYQNQYQNIDKRGMPTFHISVRGVRYPYTNR